MRNTSQSVLVVDLNNFARYPTMSVGYIVSILRQAGMRVNIFSPLANGVPGMAREERAAPFGWIDSILRHRTAISSSKIIRDTRAHLVRHIARPDRGARFRKILTAFQNTLIDHQPDVVLISTYTMYLELCKQMIEICRTHSIPVLVGGSYMNLQEIAEPWLSIEGLSGVVGGEVEPYLTKLVEAVSSSHPLSSYAGIHEPGSLTFTPTPPLQDLDALPFPDYSDFPWDRYPNRIIPMITGRGCGWGVCSFCSDVVGSIGRTYRSRSVADVMSEIGYQREQHKSRLFVFNDLKLNSNVVMWRALIDQLPVIVRNPQWTAAVHVGLDDDNGLEAEDLKAAAAAGLSRITTGLESGSPEVLQKMSKGTELTRTTKFLKAATEAGISVRTTLIVGYPGETAEDLALTTKFLQESSNNIDRIQMNRLSLMPGTPLTYQFQQRPKSFPNIQNMHFDAEGAEFSLELNGITPYYRKALSTLIKTVHKINRKKLPERATPFKGVM